MRYRIRDPYAMCVCVCVCNVFIYYLDTPIMPPHVTKRSPAIASVKSARKMLYCLFIELACAQQTTLSPFSAHARAVLAHVSIA